MEPTLFRGEYSESTRIVYTPSTFAKNNLIHLQEVGTLKAINPYTNRREALSSYLFFTILEGSGTVEYQGISYDIKKGDCIFIDCRNPHAHRSSDDLWKLAWIHFSGPNMKEIYEKFMERSGSPCFSPNMSKIYELIFKKTFDLASSDDYIRDMKLTEQLTTLITHLMEDCWKDLETSKSSRAHLELHLIKEHLDTNFTKKILLDDLAKEYFINKFHLERIFKVQYGTSITQYIINTRITRAKQLLRFSDLSIEEIGQQCGMDDANYFSRTFKKSEAMSPGSFRKQWKSKRDGYIKWYK